MSKMMLSPNRLLALLEPQGFWLRGVNDSSKTIFFARHSSITPLYEHLIVNGQGKHGEAVYATTAVSGSTNHSYDDCISEQDSDFLFILETEKDHHWTLVRTKSEAEIWEKRLAEVADFQCRATALAKGSLLRERLLTVFSIVDRYISKIGNMNDVFAAEFRFIQESPAPQRIEAERLASLIGDIGETSDDVLLACLYLFLFAAEVEGKDDVFRGKKWHNDADMRVRVYLLVDEIREKRKRHHNANSGRC